MADENNEKDARLGGKRPKTSLLPKSKPDAEKSKTANRLFNLLILAFILYGVYSFMQKGGDAGILNELGAKLDVIDNWQEGDPRVDRLKHQQRNNALDRVFPVKRPAISKRILEEGHGAPATCGQIASYQLIENSKTSETRQLRIGSVSAPQGLTLALEGMRPGERRKTTIPPSLWNKNNSNQPTQLTLELQHAKPPLPVTNMPLRRFLIKGGSGYPLRCGDLAVMHLTLWNAKGEQIFTSKNGKPVYFYIGEGQVPYGIERGVLEMAPGGVYSLILAPEYWTNLAADSEPASPAPALEVQAFPTNLEIPNGQMILVDIDYPKNLPAAASSPLPAEPETVTEPLLQTPTQ